MGAERWTVAAMIFLLLGAGKPGEAGQYALESQAIEAEQAQQEQYLRQRLMQNRVNLQSSLQGKDRPANGPAGSMDLNSLLDANVVGEPMLKGFSYQDDDLVLDGIERQERVAPGRDSKKLNLKGKLRSPSYKRFDIYVPYTGAAAVPVPGEKGFISQRQLEMLRETRATPEPDKMAPTARCLEAEYDIRILRQRAQVTMSLTVELAGEGWKTLKIPLDPAVPTSWRYDRNEPNSELVTFDKSGSLALFRFSGSGRHALELELMAPCSGNSREGRLSLASSPSPITQIRMNGIARTSEVIAAGPVRHRRGKHRIWLGPSAPVQLSWRPRIALPGISDGPIVTATDDRERVTVDSFTVLSPAINHVGMTCLARFTVSRVGTRTLRFSLPEGYDFLSAKITSGQKVAGISRLDMNQLAVRLKERTRGEVTLHIESELLIADSSSESLQLVTPRFPGAERETGHLALLPEPGTDVSRGTARGVRAIDLKELPAFASPLRQPALSLVHAFQRPGFELSAVTQRRQRLEVARLDAPRASAQTLITDAGRSLTSITYQIRNSREQFLELGLPVGAELESVTVGGRPVKPALSGTSNLLVPLSPSSRSGRGPIAVPVTVVYGSSTPPLSQYGNWKSAVPRTSVAVEDMLWQVHLPGSYRFFRTDGAFRESSQSHYPAPGKDKLERQHAGRKASQQQRFDGMMPRDSPAPPPSSAYRKGLFGLSAPIPATHNSKTYRIRLMKANDPPPDLEIFYAHRDLSKTVQVTLCYLSFLVAPLLLLPLGMAGRIAGLCLALAVAGSGSLASSYLGIGPESIGPGFLSGLGLALVYWLFWFPRRRWMASSSTVALLAFLSVAEAATGSGALDVGGHPAGEARHSEYRRSSTILVPFKEGELGRHLQSLSGKVLVPSSLVDQARARDREKPPTDRLKPPVAYSVIGASLEGDIAGDTGHFRIEFLIDVLQEGAHSIDLLDGEVAVSEVWGDGKLTASGSRAYLDQEIRQSDVVLENLSRKRSRIPILPAQLRIGVHLEGTGRKWIGLEVIQRKPFRFRILPAVACHAVLTFDQEGVDADLSGALKGHVTSRRGQTIVTADLQPGGLFQLSGYEAAPVKRMPDRSRTREAPAPRTGTAPAPPQPKPAERQPFVSARLRTDLSVGESLVKGFSVIDYEVNRARAKTLHLDVPEGTRILKVTDTRGRSLPVPRLPEASDGFHSVTLPSPPGFQKKIQMVLHFELPLKDGQTTFQAPIPRTGRTEFEAGHVTVQRDGPVGIKSGRLEKIESIPPERLPFATSPATSLAFEYSRRGAVLELEVTRHDESQMATVALDGLAVSTEYAESGGALTQAEISVRRSSGRFLRIRLPEGCDFLRAYRGGVEVEVSAAEDGALQLPLDVARSGSFQSTVLRVEYRGPDFKPQMYGQFQYELPRLDLPVTGSGASWVLAAPNGYRFYPDVGHLEGSADILGLTGKRRTGRGVYLLGPGDRVTFAVRFLSRVPTSLVEICRNVIGLLCGAALVVIIDGSLPGALAAGLLVFALCCGSLGLLRALYPPVQPGIYALLIGIVSGILIVLFFRVRNLWRCWRGVALLIAASVIGTPLWAAPDAVLIHADAEQVGTLLSGGDWHLLPGKELEKLLRKLETPEAETETPPARPPVPLLAREAALEVKIGPDEALVQAIYRYEVLEDRVHVISMQSPGPLEYFRIDGQRADVTAHPDGRLKTYLRGLGKHEITMRFRRPVSRVKDSGWVEWWQPRFPMTRLRMTLVGTGRGVEVVPALRTISEEFDGTTRAEAVLRMTGNVFIRWFEKGQEVTVVEAPAVKARYQADTATGYRLEGDRLSGKTGLRYTVTRGAITGLTVDLGEGTEVMSVTGGSVKHWDTETSGALRIDFDRFRNGTDQIWIEHVRRVPRPSGSSGPSQLRITVPGVSEAASQSRIVAVRTGQRVEVGVHSTGELRAIDPSELPQWLRSGGIPLAFKDEGSSSRLRLLLSQRESLDTPAFEIPRMSLSILPGPDGWLVNRLELSARNNIRQHLLVKLPEGAVPLDCRIQGEPRKPGVTPDGLLVPLVRSTGMPDQLAAFPVEITYVTQVPLPAGAMGSWKLPMPRLHDVPVARLDVNVSSPRGRNLALLSDSLRDSRAERPGRRISRVVSRLAKLANPLGWARSAGLGSMALMKAPMQERASLASNEVFREVSDTRRVESAKVSRRNRQKPRRPEKKARPQAPGRSGGRRGLELSGDDFEADEMPEEELSFADAAPATSTPKPTSVSESSFFGGKGAKNKEQARKQDAYLALQNSLGDRGALPVGIRNSVGTVPGLWLQGSLYPAGGTPSHLELLVYDQSVRQVVELGLVLFTFFMTMLTVQWAIRRSWRLPFFLVLLGLPLIGLAMEWRLGGNTLRWIGFGMLLGLLGALTRMKRRSTEQDS